MAWAFAKLELVDESLLDALAAQALSRLATLQAQECANIAWSFASILVQNPPLMEAIAASSRNRIAALMDDAVFPNEAAVLLWSFWRFSMTDRSSYNSLIARASNPTQAHVLWMSCSWNKAVPGDLTLWQRLQSYTGLHCIQPLALRWWGSRPVEASRACGYGKLIAVLKQIESEIVTGSVPSFLEAAERFAMESEGSWLKVAGGQKAGVLQDSTNCAPLAGGPIMLELGCFIGYTAARLAHVLQDRFRVGPVAHAETRLVSVEADPLHCAVARHFLDLAQVASVAEVQPGMVRDVLPLAVESFGALGLVFMDQKGTAFHLDLALLDRLAAWPPGACTVADNVLRPGAPLYVFQLRHQSCTSQRQRDADFWSLPEFLEEHAGVEDWMAVTRLEGGASRSSTK
eukprot:gnl/TRDRNA2_/TRDRNA2_152225_c0_seq1.p1 gnl/TRDRNA2_/TRDRNA2_152225_c0~~gnl/TRDRNA2_/TRDRNA2_152225_c0_seq1.p1  ORF type:complete len:402 (+),score=59.97 gnl/TRDRNA2_/TRDRNA2_152225_c0_seq1:104-1309(+)